MYWVYIHTNKVTGKKYVGQTAKEPKYRWGKSGRGYATQTKFFNAILKYGWDNFSHQVIEVDSQKEANYLERYLIAFYDTIKNGYNISPGGKNNVGGISEETRKKISEAKKGKPCSEEHKLKNSIAQKGKPKPHSEEHCRHIAENHVGMTGRHHSEEGKRHISEALRDKPKSEEAKKKLSEARKGKPSPNKGLVKEKALYQNSETGQIREMAVQNYKKPCWIRIN